MMAKSGKLNVSSGRMKRVALLIPREGWYDAGVLRGIQRYATRARNWRCEGATPNAEVLEGLRTFRPDGIIGTFHHRENSDKVGAMRVPTLDIGGENTAGPRGP